MRSKYYTQYLSKYNLLFTKEYYIWLNNCMHFGTWNYSCFAHVPVCVCENGFRGMWAADEDIRKSNRRCKRKYTHALQVVLLCVYWLTLVLKNYLIIAWWQFWRILNILVEDSMHFLGISHTHTNLAWNTWARAASVPIHQRPHLMIPLVLSNKILSSNFRTSWICNFWKTFIALALHISVNSPVGVNLSELEFPSANSPS